MSNPSQTTQKESPVSIDLFNKILSRKGWTPQVLAELNDPTYARLLDMDVVVEHLHRLAQSQELLVILPDFDMDGITAGSLGYAGLSELGLNVALYRPDHARGHGFGPYDIERITDQFPDVRAIITCDTGIDSYEGIDHAVKLGLTVLVTDHHLEMAREGRDTCLPAHAVVDPSRLDETYPNKGICGAHVLYQVLVAYAEAHRRDKLDEVSLLRLFAGIGTVSDVMPLVYENRRLVADSISIAKLLYVEPETDDQGENLMPDIERSTLMQLLRSRTHHPRYVSAFEGMARVVAHFAKIGKVRDARDINEGFYGFYLAPAFNAIRRMEGSMDDGFGAFFANDKDPRIARVIEDNDRRKEMVKALFKEILDSDQPHAPYVYTVDAIKGMLGLLANKLMEHNGGVPTAVLSKHPAPDGKMSGSCRSPMWYKLSTAVRGAGFHAAGHEYAFGVRIDGEHELARLAEFMQTDSSARLAEIQAQPGYEAPGPDLRFGPTEDCDDDGEDMDDLVDLARLIETLQPFGHGFEEPVIEVVADLKECKIATIGAEKNHLRITLPSGAKCLHWGEAETWVTPLREAADGLTVEDRIVRLTGRLSLNHYMGNVTPNFMVQTIRLPGRD